MGVALKQHKRYVRIQPGVTRRKRYFCECQVVIEIVPMERLVWRQVTIPKGLSSLLELICTETIRHNPDGIYNFIADLLEKEYAAEVDRK